MCDDTNRGPATEIRMCLIVSVKFLKKLWCCVNQEVKIENLESKMCRRSNNVVILTIVRRLEN